MDNDKKNKINLCFDSILRRRVYRCFFYNVLNAIPRCFIFDKFIKNFTYVFHRIALIIIIYYYCYHYHYSLKAPEISLKVEFFVK